MLLDKYTIDSIVHEGLKMEFLHVEVEKDGVILQLHGGGYIRDLSYRPNLYRRMAQQYAEITKRNVLTIDYSIAPANIYSCALEDAVKAFNYLIGMSYLPNKIVVVVDSAGGGLALALTM